MINFNEEEGFEDIIDNIEDDEENVRNLNENFNIRKIHKLKIHKLSILDNINRTSFNRKEERERMMKKKAIELG